MPTIWFSLKKTLHCKSEPSEVHDPKSRKHLSTILTRKAAARSGCSRSIVNLKDVIHGSKMHLEKPQTCSPRSIGSSEFINPIAHEVILSNSKCELKISGYGGGFNGNGGFDGSTYVGTLKPGTPSSSSSPHPARKSAFLLYRQGSAFEGPGNAGVHLSNRVTGEVDSNECYSVTCHKCGEKLSKWENAEAHHLSKHAVTELVEGDSSRKIVEIICGTSWLKPQNSCGWIERVLKVHNMQRTLARFEEHREMVKSRANKLPKKHPRCIADGNELLRFYGTTVACCLGINGSSSLCMSEKCCACRIIRHGFSTNKELKDGIGIGIGVFTTSTSGRAFENIEILDDQFARKALIVCRVIAGRVHRPVENINEMASQKGFDSLAGKLGIYSDIEDLYLLNPRALLPCFVVICKT